MPVESIAEDLLGLTIEESEDLECSGMLLPAERVIRRERPRARDPRPPQRFTIAHELGHWVCHARERPAAAPVYCRAVDVEPGRRPHARARGEHLRGGAAHAGAESTRCVEAGSRRGARHTVRRLRRARCTGGSTTCDSSRRNRNSPGRSRVTLSCGNRGSAPHRRQGRSHGRTARADARRTHREEPGRIGGAWRDRARGVRGRRSGRRAARRRRRPEPRTSGATAAEPVGAYVPSVTVEGFRGIGPRARR